MKEFSCETCHAFMGYSYPCVVTYNNLTHKKISDIYPADIKCNCFRGIGKRKSKNIEVYIVLILFVSLLTYIICVWS
jgi:hypothetical protein